MVPPLYFPHGQFYFERGAKQKGLGINSEVRTQAGETQYKSRILQESERSKLSARRQKFVSLNPRRDAALSAIWFRADDLRKTSNVDVTSKSNFTGQCENKFQGRPGLKIRIAQKI
jgi:hypothetical protein